MRTCLLIFIFAATLMHGSSAEPEKWAPVVTLLRIEDRKEVEGYWSLSSEWTHYMGIALELRGGEFRYWFMSDVHTGREPKYPVTGKYTVEGGILVLSTPLEVYDTRWLLVSHDGRIGLFPYSGFDTIIGRKESPHIRMLFRVDDAKAKKKWPLYNEPE